MHPKTVVYICSGGREAIEVVGIFLSWVGIEEGYRASRWVPVLEDTQECVYWVLVLDMLQMY